MKIHVVLLVAIAAVLGPAVSGAQLPPELLPDDIHIAGVDVSGMRPDLASRLVHRRFDRAIRLTYGERRWKVTPWLLAESAAFQPTVERAMSAEPGTRLKLPVVVQREWVRHYVDYIGHQYYRAPVNAKRMGLRGLKPYVSPARYGIRVRKAVLVGRITRNLLEQRRVPIMLATAPVAPRKLRKDFGPEIVIRRLSNALYLYKGGKLWRKFSVATGSPYYPSPNGNFTIVDKQRWPAWYPPNSSWAKGLKPIPPGPNNPLGTRWMGLSVYGVGIHGTPNPASIGYSASHGCIRMRIPEAEWLFDHVGLGTPVYIVEA